MTEFRVEKDSMGEVRVPAQAYYGAQTQRAVENFPISGWPLPPSLIHALGLVKFAAAVATLGKSDGRWFTRDCGVGTIPSDCSTHHPGWSEMPMRGRITRCRPLRRCRRSYGKGI